MTLSLSSILALVLQNPQAIETTISGLVNMFKATTAASPTVVPAAPATTGTPAVLAIKKAPSQTVMHLQELLNKIVKPQPPLKVDGWLGEKTEKAIEAGIAMAKPYLALLG